MNIDSLVITAVLLVLLAEVTYLVVKLPRQINNKKRMIFVDTSVVIDGRILSIAKSGFIGDTLVIPRSVIGELQFLADNADHDKRTRARYGLDVVKDLQEMAEVDVTILQDGSKAKEGVDERLLNLAKKHNGAICTIDYNLNKVAVVEGIAVLNVNELAQNLRMAYLPGEKMLLEIVQKGNDSHQGVGYLVDGTMVVVEQANRFIGKSVEIEFIRSSDVSEHRRATKQPSRQRRQSQPRASAPQHAEKAPADASLISNRNDTSTNTPKRQTRRPKTSAQREAALIDLVDNQ
ncbi:MAG: hypothetical protein EOO17_00755 [Chloroflexi bacterium]|nr:MAG: hypothetical protein EOO17_00755 [Chloroflexota bacterium]